MRLVIVVALLCVAQSAIAQSHDSTFRVTHSVPFSLRLIMPSVATDAYDLRNAIAEQDLSDSTLARDSFDEIYLSALALTHGRVTDALLVSTLGTLEHESVPLHLFGTTIALPLSTESHRSFERRVTHLPRHLYGIPEDDRDKLQHFFGSAWVKQFTGMTWLARLAGIFVEAGEGTFSIEGAGDPRDLRADDDGVHFGTVATANPDVLPSETLRPNP